MSFGCGFSLPSFYGAASGLGMFASASLFLDFTSGNQTLDPRITFTRGSNATRVNTQGLIETVGSNVPRFDYDPITLQPKGLLIEEQRTNLLTYSEQFADAAWTKGSASIAANVVTAPDGTLTADKLVEGVAGDGGVAHYTAQTAAVTSGVRYCQSIFAKKGDTGRYLGMRFGTGTYFSSEAATFNLDTGTVLDTSGVTSASIKNVGNGWYLCSITAVCKATGTPAATLHQFLVTSSSSATTYAYTGDGTSGIYIWGAQLEAGSFPTSYIPTTSAQATRVADVATMTGTNFSSWYRQDEGTLFVEWHAPQISGTQYIISTDDGSDANRIVALSSSTAGASRLPLVTTLNVQQAGVAPSNTVANSVYKWAMVYRLDDFIGSANGVIATADISGSVPTVNALRIGNRPSGAASLNGHIKRIAYYNRRLLDSELKALTS